MTTSLKKKSSRARTVEEAASSGTAPTLPARPSGGYSVWDSPPSSKPKPPAPAPTDPPPLSDW